MSVMQKPPTQSSPLRISVVAMEIPYPPVHGGRVDIWRRLKALKRVGVEVQLICWSPTVPDAATMATLREQVSDIYLLNYPRGLWGNLRRLWDLLRYPLEITSRLVRGKDLQRLQRAVAAFRPHVMMADHVHCGVVAHPISQALQVPMIVRSHDIEHLHYRELMRTAPDLKSKVMRFFSQNHLEAYEKGMFRRCLAFYDISAADLEFWQQQGYKNGYFLPPLIDLADLDTTARLNAAAPPTFEYDAVFLGNLRTDNNVAGVLWFLEQVMPLLRSQRPDIRVAIAGSNPVDRIVQACDRTPNVVLLPNPPDAAAVYRSGRACIDPVAVGRGVSLKSLDMLAAGRPIVSFAKGTSGLPESVKIYFHVADDAPSFASAILDCLDRDGAASPDPDLLAAELGDVAIERFVRQLSTLLFPDHNGASRLMS